MEKLENRLTESEKELLISNFGKKKVSELEELTGIKKRSITQFYKNRGLKLTKTQKKKVLLRRDTKYDRNHDFFNSETSTSAYWAGFIAADGCITNQRLRIKIKYTDKKHLEKFKKDIQYTGIIKKDCSERLGKLHCGALLYISSPIIIKDLRNNYNITSNKSLSLEEPNIKNKKQIDSFIVGYFDGDGTVYRKKNYLCARFYGTEAINKWIKNRVDSLYGKNSGSIFKKGNIHCYELNPKATIFFGEYFGKLDLPTLNRKWNKLKKKRR